MYFIGIRVMRVIDNLNDVIKIIDLSDMKELMVLSINIQFDN